MIIVHLMNVFNLFSDAGGKYETYNGVNIGLKWKVEHEGGQIQRCSICCLLLLHTLRIPMHNGASNEIKEIEVCKKCPKVKPYCGPIFDPIMFKLFWMMQN